MNGKNAWKIGDSWPGREVSYRFVARHLRLGLIIVELLISRRSVYQPSVSSGETGREERERKGERETADSRLVLSAAETFTGY